MESNRPRLYSPMITMKIMKPIIVNKPPFPALLVGSGLIILLIGGLILSNVFGTTSAFDTAGSVIDSKYKSQVLWVKGSGTATAITQWTYYFYDPTSSSSVRTVRVVNGKIDSVQPGEFKSKPTESLVFNPAKTAVSTETALSRTRAYAEQNHITYDAVKVQLRRNTVGEAPAWRVMMFHGDEYKGTLYLKETDGSVVSYQPRKSGSGNGFFNDVKDTFLGIGGDLENFFTGERTVDQ